MRIHLAPEVIAARRLLSERHRSELRTRLEALKTDQTPDWTIPVASKPGMREFFVGGFWFGFTVDRTGAEPAIIVASAEEN